MRHNQFRVAIRLGSNVTKIMIIMALTATGAISIGSLHGHVVTVKQMDTSGK